MGTLDSGEVFQRRREPGAFQRIIGAGAAKLRRVV
jgi:hypothetical protein